MDGPFFLDRNLPPDLVQVFAQTNLRAVHHNTFFAQTTQNTEIIEYVAQQDLILVTYDRKMRSAHSAALAVYKPRVIFLTAAFASMRKAEQFAWYATTWPQVCRKLGVLPAQAQVRVNKSGGITYINPGVLEANNPP